MTSIIGRRFGKLTVIDYSMESNGKKVACKCDCGKYVTVFSNNLYTGRTKSCGCSKGNKNSKSSMYRRYQTMKHTGSDFESYEDFKAWLMENETGDLENFSVKRIDTKMPFSRSNCYIKWH